MKDVFDVIILGAGAGGMLCASSIKNKKVAVVDCATKPAKKIMVTGNGRCNLTNVAVSSNAYNQNIDKYLRRFDEKKTLNFFEKLGLVVYSDEEGRVYPLSNSAKSVVDVLEYGAKDCNFFLGEKLSQIVKKNDMYEVSLSEKTLKAQNLVIATGGGSIDILKMLNVEFKEFVPSLVSLKSKSTRDLNGTRVPNVLVSAKNSLGVSKSERGEVLFRENGLSGIVIFNLSTLFSRCGCFDGNVKIDLLPDMKKDEVENLLRRRKNKDVLLDKLFVGMFVNSVSNEIFKQSKINTNVQCKMLSEEQISLLAKTIKSLNFEICGHLENNQVFCGGVPLDALDENLMHKKNKGLFFVGEICDVDGVCGGFNLQWAWTSGHIVGEKLC